jgi:hypothetical protein
MKHRLLAVVAVFILLGSIIPAKASANDQPQGRDGLHCIVSPYVWLTSLNASIGIGGFTTNVNSPFVRSSGNSGVDLHAAFLGQAEVIYADTAGLFANVNYASLTGQFGAASAYINGNASLLLSDVLPFYRFGRWNLGPGTNCQLTVDGLAGVRIWDISIASLDYSWVDPLVGSRVALRLFDDWTVTLRGAIGGFAVSSAFTWDINATVGYEFYKNASLLLGYRAVGINRDSGNGNSLKLKGTIDGPVVGLSYAF